MQSGNWVLKIKPHFLKTLRRFPRKDKERIEQAIDLLIVDPFAGDVKKMEGREDIWRCRVGAYRILYQIKTEERVVAVHHVERRTSQTY